MSSISICIYISVNNQCSLNDFAAKVVFALFYSYFIFYLDIPLKLHFIFPNIVYTLNPVKFVIIHKVIRPFFKLIVLIKGYIILILLLLYCTLSAIGCTTFSTLI